MRNPLAGAMHEVSEHLGLQAESREQHLSAAQTLESKRLASLGAYTISLLSIGAVELADPPVYAPVAMAAVATAVELVYVTVPPLYHRFRARFLLPSMREDAPE